MQFKKYLVNDKSKALERALSELGPDATLLSERSVRRKGWRGLFQRRVLEVTFAYDPDTVPSKLKRNAAFDGAYNGVYNGAIDSSTAASVALLDEKIEKLENIQETLISFMNKFDIIKRDITYDYPDDIQALLSKMIDSQVREELAHTLAKQTEKLMRERPGSSAAEILEHLMQEQLGRPEPILHKKFTQKVVLVLGPTGVGKTTSVVKLAAGFVKQRMNIGIINTDIFRIGAKEQLKTYADILKSPFQLVYYPEEVEKAMEEMKDRDIIFIDTAGKRPGDEEYKEDLLKLVRIIQPEDTLLCLSATTSFAAVKEIVDTYGFLDDYRIIVTKLDETKYRGALLNISWYANKPFAYVTTGQNVPADIEIANVEKLAKEILL